MINLSNLKSMLLTLGFEEVSSNKFKQEYNKNASITVDFNIHRIDYYPVDANFKEGEFPSKNKPSNGFILHRDTTINFSSNENFVCLVCAHYLLKKGYEPKHIIFEPAFPSGGSSKPCFGDIFVYDKEYNPLILIENKTYGPEFSKEWNKMQRDGGQLFSYLANMSKILTTPPFVMLFTAEFEENKTIYKNHIITLKDNESIVKESEKDKQIKLFSNQRYLLYDVWDETYGKAFETSGIFEDDISPYTIGKQKYTINDLKELTHAQIKPLYHEFATILRNNAITDFEHSFYILIDLFLCKITDERNNPNDLQFYYKGATRDTPKEYCGRLLKLYKQGKKELFKIDVVNKEEDDIRKIFKDKARSLTNGLYESIKEFFEDVKYYNIKKFNFISVENKEEFEQNFKILIKMAALIQDINLSSSETNHFFGDLFEGLLAKNVHQTEGQFFTPLPIVNFIINSLPNCDSIKNFKVLDFACGAGHFLTEFSKRYKNAKLYGIEKNQNLSQVAKIATILNGNEDANIIFKDTLSSINPKMTIDKDFSYGSFDLIISNPPFSVKGFLDTLDDGDRDQYALIKYIEEKAYSTNNSIECFFIERTLHLLKDNGVFAIILPRSVLDNGNIYIKARELLFENFNILSIVQLNSRTFGSTGTNTIIVFAQKIGKNSIGLVDTFKKSGEFTQYTNKSAIFEYMEKQNYSLKDYCNLMQKKVLSNELEKNQIIDSYKKSFKPVKIQKNIVTEWFQNSNFYKKEYEINKKEYKTQYERFLQSDEYKKNESEEIKKQLIDFIISIETDKLITYANVYDSNIIILFSPPDKKNNKSNKTEIIEFLGYDWSTRKGSEGIKYVTESQHNIKDDSDDDKTIEIINSINYIKTPLYNPINDMDTSKFAYALKRHIWYALSDSVYQLASNDMNESYNGENDLIKYGKLVDLIDFSNANFDKAIRFVDENIIEIKSKYDLIQLKDFVKIESGSRPSGGVALYKEGTLSIGGEHIDNFSGRINLQSPKYVPDNFYNEAKSGKVKANDILICKDGALTGKVAIVKEELNKNNAMVNEHVFIIRTDESKLLQMYLFEILHSQVGQQLLKQNVKKSAQGGLNQTNLLNVKIPYPPLSIQKKVVTECLEVDENFEKIRMSIEEYQNKIRDIFEKFDVIMGGGYELVTLKSVCKELFAGGDAPKNNWSKIKSSEYYVPIYSNGTDENSLYGYTNIEKVLEDAVTISARGTIGYVDLRKAPFFPIVRLIVAIPNERIDINFLKYTLQFTDISHSGSSTPQLTIPMIENVKIKLPNKNIQANVIKECLKYEEKINLLKNEMKAFENTKQNIFNKYLF